MVLRSVLLRGYGDGQKTLHVSGDRCVSRPDVRLVWGFFINNGRIKDCKYVTKRYKFHENANNSVTVEYRWNIPSVGNNLGKMFTPLTPYLSN